MRVLTLSTFDVDWKTLTGSFRLSVDGSRSRGRFRFAPGTDSAIHLLPPALPVPFEATGDFQAVNLPDVALTALQAAVARLLPRLRPVGAPTPSGGLVEADTDVAGRIEEVSRIQGISREVGRAGHRVSVRIGWASSALA